ncbi:MAG: LUD domain-containing protein [Bacteroidetes bacterium]|nr:LUD domain-containing protein [Bacteroidota bacterium]
MSSRDKILAAVKKNQPPMEATPDLNAITAIRFDNPVEKFTSVLEGIGGKVLSASDTEEVFAYVRANFIEGNRFITTIAGAQGMTVLNGDETALSLEDLEAAVIEGSFAVAENSAIWVTNDAIKVRVLPFICQHLVVVVRRSNILHNMHEAYARIGAAGYGFGVFIAGPSKTADIEQSLVLGAHGPRSMTVFLMD